jgi:oligopeptide/dipeptide ABC transporter ATP-binding protein
VTALLQADELWVHLPVGGARKPVLRGLSFAMAEGEAVAIVGESGSGKSMTARAVARLLPSGATTSGAVRVLGDSVFDMPAPALREFRSTQVGMIFQDPRSHINPVLTLGDFLTEPLIHIRSMSRRAARDRVLGLLEDVGVNRPDVRLRQYPHQLSGGQLQRMMIASVLAMEPKLILADEPTTALDVTTQSDVMSILDDARRDRGMGLIFITHDLELAAAVCDRTVVMYAGSIMEDQASAQLHRSPLHPYTAALLRSRPRLTSTTGVLDVIPGRPLSAVDAPTGCPFLPRCGFGAVGCETAPMVPTTTARGRTSCIRIETLAPLLTGENEPSHA